MNNSVAVETLAANKMIAAEHRVRARRILGAHICPEYGLYPALKEHEERILHHLEQGCAEEHESDEMVAAAAVVRAYALHWVRFVGDRQPTNYQLQVLMRASRILITIVASSLIDARDRRMTVVTPRSIKYAAVESAQRLAHYRERIEDFLTNTWGNTLAHGVR